MIRKLSLLSLAALLCLSACFAPADEAAEPTPADEPATSETAQSLSVFNWTSAVWLSQGRWTAQLATIGSRIIMVQVDANTKQLLWSERVGVNNWTSPTPIPNHLTGTKPSLAAYNGYLYMIHTDSTVATRLWMSRFTPSTNSWSTPFLLSHMSFNGPPAMAAYNGLLHLVGVAQYTYQLWHATMNTAETFTAGVLMAGSQSYSRVSLAVAHCRLYLVHRANTGFTVAFNWFNGTSWSPESIIPAGVNGAGLVAAEPVIAERAGYLHLIYRATSSYEPQLWWTYFDKTSWAAAVAIGTVQSQYQPSLTTGGSGLVALVSQYDPYPMSTLEYAQALPPKQPLPCLAGANL